MRALRTIAAVFWTAAGLDTEQTRRFDVVRIKAPAMKTLGLKQQIGKRQTIERFGLGAPPVGANRSACVLLVSLCSRAPNHTTCFPRAIMDRIANYM